MRYRARIPMSPFDIVTQEAVDGLVGQQPDVSWLADHPAIKGVITAAFREDEGRTILVEIEVSDD